MQWNNKKCSINPKAGRKRGRREQKQMEQTENN